MSRQHYYLVAGLPDIFFDDKKISVSLVEYRSYLSEYLTDQEMQLIKLHFWQFDNENILNRLEKKEEAFNTSANLNADEMDELFSASKDGSYESLSFSIPAYIIEFIDAYRDDSPLIEGKSWELQLTERYFEYLQSAGNTFIADWFAFEQNLKNVLTAYNCRIAGINIENQLIGKGEINTKLLKSSTRDFGIDSDDLIGTEIVFKALEANDLMEQEKRMDTLRWELLDEHSFFHYFSIEKLFVFLIKLSIVERWISLDKTKGLELFKELLSSLESSYEFPAEFSLK